MRFDRFLGVRHAAAATPHAATIGTRRLLTACETEINPSGIGTGTAASRRRHPQVLLVAPLPPPPLVGGIETGVALLLDSAVAKTASIQLFNTARDEDATRPLHRRLGHQTRMCLRFAATVVRTRPRIVHVKTASGVNFYQSALYVAIGRLLGRKVLLQLHGGDFRGFYERAGGMAQACVRATLRAPHGLLALSAGWASYLRSISGAGSISIVPNALQTAAFCGGSRERTRFGIGHDRVALLFVAGRLAGDGERKGLPQLMQAVAQVRTRRPELLLVIAGPHCDATALRSAVGPDGEAWIGLGVVSTEDKPALYRAADLFALPSRAENMPNTVLEAMAAGLPVVATPVGAVAEMIRDGESGFIVPVGDVPALADRIEQLVSDPALRQRMGAQAAETAARNYDLAALERQLLAAYQRVGPIEVSEPTSAAAGGAPRARIVWHRRLGVRRHLHRLSRLVHMHPAEIIHRGRRTAAKHAARVRWQLRPQAPSDHQAAAGSPALNMAGDPAAYLAERGVPRGFFTPGERRRRAAIALERLRPQVERTLREATAILTDGIDLLGRRFRPADPEFDWLADPEHGRLWPLTILDDSDAALRVRADVKFVWEVNRHQFLVTLARAYTYSGDARYAHGCLDMVRRWIAANPPAAGVNWASSLEVAIRALSWTWSLHFLLGTPVLTAGDLRVWLASLCRHRDHLATHLSTYTDPTNHLIGEAAALAVLTTWFPEWANSRHLRTVAFDTLQREVARQVAADGVDREQAMSYQRFVLDLLLQVIALAGRNGIALPPALRSCALSMLQAVRVLVGRDHRAPRIGDSDEARGIPFFTEDFWDFGELLGLGAAVLGCRTGLCEGVRPSESALWLGGEAALRPPEDVSEPEPWPGSELLAEGGYAVLRSVVRPREDRLVFDCGPLGYPPHASHGHADLLSILVDVGGEEVLADAGTFAYYDEAGRRDLLRATRAHNTVEVGGWDQADAFEPFKWLNQPRSRIEVSRLGPGFDYVEAWHDGYQRLRPAVRHRRAVLGVGGSWLLIDWIEGRGEHQFIRWFHAVPTVQVDRLDGSSIRLRTPSGHGALVLRDLVGTDADASTAIGDGLAPYSERYGQMLQAPVVRFVDRARLPAIRLTLLTVERASPRRCGLEVAESAGTRAAGGLWMRLIEPCGARVEVAVRAPGAPLRVGPIQTDARLVVVRLASGAAPTIFSSGGNHVEGIRAF